MSNPTEEGKAETERQEEAAEQQSKAAYYDGCAWRLYGLFSFIVGIIMFSPFLLGTSMSASVDSLILPLLGIVFVLAGIMLMIFGRWSLFF